MGVGKNVLLFIIDLIKIDVRRDFIMELIILLF